MFRISGKVFRMFCKQVKKAETNTIMEPVKSNQVPVYLRKYDKTKYEVLGQKIKMNSGYSFLDVQPFPRARIMRICYNLLQQLSIGFPETAIFRIYNQQKVKYLMKIVDQTTSIEQIQKILGVETIQLFIENLGKQFQLYDLMRRLKVWQKEDSPDIDQLFIQNIKPPAQEKKPAYKKPNRPQTNFFKDKE